MKLLIFALFFAGAHALVLPPDPRCGDATYACQDLRSARDCGAVKECINDYWSTLGTPKETNEICDICKQMVQEARDQLLSNMTQEELKEVFEGSCKLLPTKAIENMCIKMVDEFIPELVEMLASRMDPTQVCTVAGLCTGERTIVKQTCEKCIDVSVGVKKMFNLIPKDLFKTTMVQQCQSKYEGLKDECQNLFGTDWDKVHEYIINLTPEGACSQMSLCEGEYQKIFKNVGDNMTCEFCENLVHYLQNILASKSLKEEIRTALNNMCENFGNYKNECQSLVTQYYDEAYDMLINELDPVKVCTSFGLCDKGSRRSEPELDRVPEEQNEVEPTPKDNLECSVCKQVMNYVKETVTDPKNEEEVREALDQACTYLPSSMTQKCQIFVNTYVDLVISLLAQEIQPEEICQYIGLCPKKENENASSIECYLCKKVINQLKSMITDSTNEEEIRQALDTVCKYMPNRYSDKCVELVNTYTDMIINLLVQQLDANAICHVLSLCSSQVEIPPQNLNSADECEICQMAVDEIENLLQNNQIDNDITEIAEKVCNILPQRYASRCQTLIENYGPYILQMLAQLADSQQICAGIDLCPSSSLVGKSRCTWGPAYWCSSPENAEKCGTVKHCQEKYWGKKERRRSIAKK